MNKRFFAFCTLFVILGGLVFSAETLFDENLPTQTKKITTSIDFKPKLGVEWGYDFQRNQSGFKEIIDIDMKWEIVPFQDFSTDTSGIEYGDPYGLVMLSGGHFMINIKDQSGDLSASDGSGGNNLVPVFSINYEKIWGKIVLDPFYVLVAANEKNFYNRHSGWSFNTANSRPRANWAHIGSRVQGWQSSFNSSLWEIAGAGDQVKTEGGEAGLGFGYIGNTTETLFMITSPLTWEYVSAANPGNKDNKYDFGLSAESNPVGNLMVQASAVSGLNYEVLPLGLSASLGYRFDITNTLAIMPHTAMDIAFNGTKSDPLDSWKMENSFGFDIIWPGTTGWGDNPLANMETNIYAGLTVDGSVVTLKGKEPSVNMAISLHEDNSGGLIQNLGTTLVFELANITGEKPKNTYGVYVDYNIWNQFKPYGRFLKTIDSSVAKNVTGEVGLEMTVIPSTVITLMYKTKDVTTISDNKGVFTTSFIVTF
ncbi:MAG TPA: hypothetical protein VJ855_04680 [Marinilabiliaceae bacterium]|nr:hypothetical protein [Marinilabiliaceae bacterium]